MTSSDEETPTPASNDSSDSDHCADRRIQLEIRPVPLEYARSHAQNWTPPWPVTPELDAYESLVSEWARQLESPPPNSDKEVIVVDLSNFEIFRSPGNQRNEFELVPLHLFDVKAKNLSLNGVLSNGQIRHYVELVRIDDYSIGGFGDDEDPSAKVYIKPQILRTDAKVDLWFRLSYSSPAYQRFHKPFIWVADFVKHVIDFLESQPDSTVGLGHFKVHFSRWLADRFFDNRNFHRWYDACKMTDFRVAINAYIDPLFNQANNIPDSNCLSHPVWGDCMKGDHGSIKEKPIICHQTISTPVVHDCFKDLYFGKFLRKACPVKYVEAQQYQRKKALGFPRDSPDSYRFDTNQMPVQGTKPILALKVGDVVGVRRDEHGPWQSFDEEWLAYIQRMEPCVEVEGVQRLFVLWLYRPHETIMKDTVYPVSKELFLSDNCNCEEGEFLSTDVTARYSVDWRPTISTHKDILIWRKYVTEDHAFVTIVDTDLHCSCGKDEPKPTQRHSRGDCVYITTKSKGVTTLEPVVIYSLPKSAEYAVVRRLLRLRDCNDLLGSKGKGNIAANQLVWTEEVISVSIKRLRRKYHLRFFSPQDVQEGRVSTPYDRMGTGDYWILSYVLKTDLQGKSCLRDLSSPPDGFIPGPNPQLLSQKPFSGLSIFSGGGNLDRGLEDGGAVKFIHAVDISRSAIHTQKANSRHPQDLKLYLGSVDDYLLALLSGQIVEEIARVGDISFIAAGSPCPGFSIMQPDWKSDASLRNASHITTLCSFLDIYRPQRALLENVVSMANVRRGYEKENVFGQLIACLVALGYQVDPLIVDSWSHGSPQRRSRLFISITAPGLKPMPHPWLTHSHPAHVIGRSLGKLTNGEQFGCREDYPTPFRYATAGDTTVDLPDIGTGTVQTCIPFPDHRLLSVMNGRNRALIRQIPVNPTGCGYAEALTAGLVPASLRMQGRRELRRAYRRIKSAGQFPTITTRLSPQDGRCGEVLHWKQHRPITVMDGRRAQGVLDDEVIIGSPAEQWTIIGNGVDRHASLALGLSLRQVWEEPCMSRLTPEEDIEMFDTIRVKPALPIVTSHDNKQPAPMLRRKLTSTEIPVQSSLTSSTTASKKVEKSSVFNSSRSQSPPLPIIGKRQKSDSDSDVHLHSADVASYLRKKTRHTGLQVEFTPASWDKVLERSCGLGKD